MDVATWIMLQALFMLLLSFAIKDRRLRINIVEFAVIMAFGSVGYGIAVIVHG